MVSIPIAVSYTHLVVIVLNVNGLIDLSWMKKYASIKSLLFIGIPGEEGASALAGILTGEINPSGKLAVTKMCIRDRGIHNMPDFWRRNMNS